MSERSRSLGREKKFTDAGDELPVGQLLFPRLTPHTRGPSARTDWASLLRAISWKNQTCNRFEDVHMGIHLPGVRSAAENVSIGDIYDEGVVGNLADVRPLASSLRANPEQSGGGQAIFQRPNIGRIADGIRGASEEILIGGVDDQCANGVIGQWRFFPLEMFPEEAK